MSLYQLWRNSMFVLDINILFRVFKLTLNGLFLKKVSIVQLIQVKCDPIELLKFWLTNPA